MMLEVGNKIRKNAAATKPHAHRCHSAHIVPSKSSPMTIAGGATSPHPFATGQS